ncbi:MAG: lysylphosphatidylglycerol synthase domain-containing protein [Pseudomonadota bacterium]
MGRARIPGLTLVLLLLGLVLFGVLLVRAGLGDVWEASRAAGPGLLLILIAPLPYFLLHTWAWLLLMPGARPSFGTALHAYVAAQALDELGGGVLGEPLKVLVVPGDDRRRGIAAVTLDNLSLLVSLVLVLVLGGILMSMPGMRSLSTQRIIPAFLIVFGVGAALAVALLVGPGRLGAWLSHRFPGGRVAAFIAGHRDVAETNRTFLTQHPDRFALGTLLHTLAKICIVGEMGLTLAVLGLYHPETAVWLGFGKLAAMVVTAPVPAQVGALDGALAWIGESMGLAAPAAMAVALLRRARSLAWIAIGLGLATRIRGKQPPLSPKT